MPQSFPANSAMQRAPWEPENGVFARVSDGSRCRHSFASAAQGLNPNKRGQDARLPCKRAYPFILRPSTERDSASSKHLPQALFFHSPAPIFAYKSIPQTT